MENKNIIKIFLIISIFFNLFLAMHLLNENEKSKTVYYDSKTGIEVKVQDKENPTTLKDGNLKMIIIVLIIVILTVIYCYMGNSKIYLYQVKYKIWSSEVSAFIEKEILSIGSSKADAINHVIFTEKEAKDFEVTLIDNIMGTYISLKIDSFE